MYECPHATLLLSVAEFNFERWNDLDNNTLMFDQPQISVVGKVILKNLALNMPCFTSTI